MKWLNSILKTRTCLFCISNILVADWWHKEPMHQQQWFGIFIQDMVVWAPGSRFNIKMSYQYRKSDCADKTILRLSYLHNGISYTCKTTSLYWIGPQKCSDLLPGTYQADSFTSYHLIASLNSTWNVSCIKVLDYLFRTFFLITVSLLCSLLCPVVI